MGKRRRKQSGFRKLVRSLYKALGAVNTASYVLAGASDPGRLAKHLTRKRTSKIGSRIVK